MTEAVILTHYNIFMEDKKYTVNEDIKKSLKKQKFEFEGDGEKSGDETWLSFGPTYLK